MYMADLLHEIIRLPWTFHSNPRPEFFRPQFCHGHVTLDLIRFIASVSDEVDLLESCHWPSILSSQFHSIRERPIACQIKRAITPQDAVHAQSAGPSRLLETESE